MGKKFESLHDLAVHVWIVPLEAPPGVIQTLRKFLSPDEALAANRMRLSDLRSASIISRGVLRVLLSRYLEKAPEELCFCNGSKGKPALFPPQPLQFNLSHSGLRAILAFAIGCEVGVDVEQTRTFPDMEAIATRFFCPDEVSDLARLPPELREQAFFRCWTRKEAYVKAIGDGLSAPLDSFRVSLRPDEPTRFLRLANGSVPWSLYNIETGVGYAAALAHPGPERALQITTTNELSSLLDPQNCTRLKDAW